MKIAFIDFINWDYGPDAPYRFPLGGMQSAACYLAQALAAIGHDVFYLSNTTTPGQYFNVTSIPIRLLDLSSLGRTGLDAFVILGEAGPTDEFRRDLGPRTRLILWTGHPANQPAVSRLANPAMRNAHDGIVFVSDWQRNAYLEKFGVDPARTVVLRNAVSPAFAELFEKDHAILPAKSSPPTLVYTSVPYYGLQLLPTIFPRIRAKVPAVRLQIYSSMKVHGHTSQHDEAAFGKLYHHLRTMEGVEYIGAVPQPELANRLRSAAMLAYPNIFAETSSIAVMEAMAAGCRVVTTAGGGLPETTAGFARLIPVTNDLEEYVSQFTSAVVEVLVADATDPDSTERSLRQQVDYVRDAYSWPLRAHEWTHWLLQLTPRGNG